MNAGSNSDGIIEPASTLFCGEDRAYYSRRPSIAIRLLLLKKLDNCCFPKLCHYLNIVKVNNRKF